MSCNLSTADIFCAAQFLDNATELIFGECVETLLSDQAEAHSSELLQSFDAALRGLGMRVLLGRLRVLFAWDRSYNRLAHKVHAVVDKYIGKAILRQKQASDHKKVLDDVKGCYIILDELVATVEDREEIRNQVLNIFLPGRDATAIGLSGVCFLLARHPRVWAKLRAEVLSMEGPVTYELLKSLKYMRFVLNEGLYFLIIRELRLADNNLGFRLIAPANRNVRLCLKDCVLPSGGGPRGTAPIFVPQGTRVSVNFGAMHRDVDIWGKDAESFRPERWEGLKPGWHYIPFSGGPRVCPGQQVALTEAAYVLVRLMQTFESMENRDPEMAFIEQSRLTTESRNGVKVALFPVVNVSS